MRIISISFTKLVSVILAASLLSACGFHLRGDYSIPEELGTLSLTSYDQYGSFTRMMKSQLRINEVNLVPPSENIPNLHIIDEGVGERNLSLYQNTTAAEKELTFTATYRVTIPDLGDKTFSTSVSRSYLENPLTALAKSVERDMIEDEMRQFAAGQIIRQMARLRSDIKAGHILTKEELESFDEQDFEKSSDIDSVE
ncbi:LPS assembly lipoprotein LptE [Vibrio hepatarius]|uniref:LPS-assembly lipoprotein LptE n=1 Tax=Vibrio hepatarius TaxID=171383 RepID=UPI001C08236F|nr:LPS assembly lipoprotein LptE [Vibrio hepatarius]MBU2898449.1 luciferase [Vibrio hepatarius]